MARRANSRALQTVILSKAPSLRRVRRNSNGVAFLKCRSEPSPNCQWLAVHACEVSSSRWPAGLFRFYEVMFGASCKLLDRMNPENYGPTTIPRLIVGLEIVFGLLVPAFVVGPLLVVGLIFGILSPLAFVLSACGAWGLVGVAMLLSSAGKISRQRAQIASVGVIAGLLVVLYLFIGAATVGWHRDKQHLDKQSIFLYAVLVGPTVVGLRRVILLWKNPPF